jgi:predicted RNA-binding protein
LRVCDANAYLVRDGAEETLLESVDLVEMDGDEAKLINIFGERKSVRARLKLFDNSQGKLLFEPV